VKSQNYLGIYVGKGTATVVCLDSQARNRNVLGCFSVAVEEQEGRDEQILANLIAQGCAERELQFSDVAVALDCAMFMQHDVHSDFADPKQITATVRFDTEEALATDISDVAIAFKISSSDQNGSELTVFTAERKILSDILLSLQSNSIDPITIEPDVNCLSRFINQKVRSPESAQGGILFGLLSRYRGYFAVVSKSQKTGAMRTFLVGSKKDREELLTREALITIALAATGEPISLLRAFDSCDTINHQRIGKKLGIEAGGVDLAEAAGIEPQTLADCGDPVDFAIAYGAALAHFEKAQSINFRNDFMPYQGKKLRLQKALKLASICVTILLLAVGLYFQMQLLSVNKNVGRLRNKFSKDYSAVMLGQRLPTKTSPTSKLRGQLRRIKDVKSGLISAKGEKSVSSKLAMILEAFNQCVAPTKLNVDSITVTDKMISIDGDTSSRANTLKLFNVLKGSFDVLPRRLESKGGRDNFSITAELKK